MKLYNFRTQSLNEQYRIACDEGLHLTSFSYHNNRLIKLYYLQNWFVRGVR